MSFKLDEYLKKGIEEVTGSPVDEDTFDTAYGSATFTTEDGSDYELFPSDAAFEQAAQEYVKESWGKNPWDVLSNDFIEGSGALTPNEYYIQSYFDNYETDLSGMDRDDIWSHSGLGDDKDELRAEHESNREQLKKLEQELEETSDPVHEKALYKQIKMLKEELDDFEHKHDKLLDKAKDKAAESYLETDIEQALSDPWNFLNQWGMSLDEMYDAGMVILDEDKLAEAVVEADGAAQILGTYDGEELTVHYVNPENNFKNTFPMVRKS